MFRLNIAPKAKASGPLNGNMYPTWNPPKNMNLAHHKSMNCKAENFIV